MSADGDDRGRSARWSAAALSLRGRILLGSAVVVTVLLVAVSFVLVRFETDASMRQLDEILSDEAEAIGLAVSLGRDIPTLLDDDRVLVVFDADDEVVESAGPFDELAALDVRTRDDQGVDRTFAGEVHRVVAESYETADGRTGTVRLAEPLDEFTDSVDALIRALVWTVPVTILVLLILVWVVVGRALRPVDLMRAEVDEIAFERLDRRVPVPRGNDELSRLAVTMNQMLSRLAMSARRQQRFVADASHELRTPIARMRAELESESAAVDGVEPTDARRSQLEELTELQRMVDDLLVLARSDAGASVPRFDAVDVDDIVLSEAAAAAGGGAMIDTTSVTGAQAFGSASEIRRLVRNLLENAVRHARSTVAVSVMEGTAGMVLHVDDDGPGIPFHSRLDVFERFHQIRTRGEDTAGRTGLGLAIVRDIVIRHGGTVHADDSPLGGARFTVTLRTPPDTR